MSDKIKYSKTERPWAEALADCIFLAVYTLLCAYSALWMAQGVFPQFRISAGAHRWLCALVSVTVAVYGAAGWINGQYAGGKRQMRLKRTDHTDGYGAEDCGSGKAMPGGLLRLAAALPVVWYGLLFYRYISRRRIDFEDGSCAIVSCYLKQFNRRMKTSFSIWHGKEEFLEMALAVWICIIVLALLCLAFITGKRICSMLLPALVLPALLLSGNGPGWKGTAFFLAAIFVTFSGAGSGRRHTLRARGRSGTGTGYLLSGAVLTVVVAAAVSAGSIFFDSRAAGMLEHASTAKRFQKNLEQKVSGLIDGWFTGQRETIDNEAPHYTGKEILSMTMSQEPAADVYLKGFYGTDYENGGWVCRRQAFAQACSTADCTTQQAAENLLSGAMVFLEAGKLDWPVMSSVVVDSHTRHPAEYVLEYRDGGGRNAWVPYFTKPQQEGDAYRLWGDVLVQKKRGADAMTFSGWNGQLDDNALTLAVRTKERTGGDILSWYDAFALDAYLDGSDRVPAAEVSRWQALRQYEANEKPEPDKYLSASQDQWLTERVTERNQMRLSVAESVCDFLRTNYKYSLNLKTLPEGEDVVNYFLSESREGFCVHFASAAVLLLRNCGIPARYVSGYLAKKEEFRHSGDGYATVVRDSDAHAWAEIYLDGFGWVPVDGTPGAGRAEPEQSEDQTDTDESSGETGTQDAEINDRTDEADPEETGADKDSVSDMETVSDTQTAGEDGSDTGTDRETRSAASRVAVMLLLLSASILCAYMLLRRGICIYHCVPEKEIRQGKYRSAVLRMNRRLYRKLALRGRIRRNSLSDEEYTEMLKEVWRQIPETDWDRYMRVVQEAAFSNRQPDEPDVWFCYRVYRKC